MPYACGAVNSAPSQIRYSRGRGTFARYIAGGAQDSASLPVDVRLHPMHYTRHRQTMALMPDYRGQYLDARAMDGPTSPLPAKVRKIVCDRKCDFGAEREHPQFVVQPKVVTTDTVADVSRCKLDCYAEQNVRVSGVEMCNTQCGALVGATDETDPVTKSMCAAEYCGQAMAEDPSWRYTAPHGWQ